MAWTYDGPGASTRDEVRFLCGDTLESDPLLSDAEIEYCLTKTSDNAAQAAIIACENIIAKLCRCADETVGSVSVSFSQRASGYKDLLAMLHRSALRSGAPQVRAGGVYWSDRIAAAHNGTTIPPEFRRRSLRYRRTDVDERTDGPVTDYPRDVVLP